MPCGAPRPGSVPAPPGRDRRSDAAVRTHSRDGARLRQPLRDTTIRERSEADSPKQGKQGRRSAGDVVMRPSGPRTDELRRALGERYRRVRAATEVLAAALSDEDQQIQSMPLASPTKWHRAHTTWFFEAFVLEPAGIAPWDPRFAFLFNSYYDAVGARLARPKRGLVSRPAAQEIGEYRRVVDDRLLGLVASLDDAALSRVALVVETGLAHEEQHQELLLTDILHAFSESPCAPVYRAGSAEPCAGPPLRWVTCAGGLQEIGTGPGTFAFDNERPRHRVFLEEYALASRPVSVGDVKAFIDAGGYDTPSLWLAEGHETARALGWRTPGYATYVDGVYHLFTLRGLRAPHDDEPASHLSFWEADALARFLGGRLPTEAEWESAAAGVPTDVGNFADGPLVPLPPSPAMTPASEGIAQLFGDVWEWTRSSYEPYPGYRPPAGALGEYNGKFMAQQMVLRGGSCLTPRGHLRAGYRNYWPPETRFQMSGARVARDR